MAGRQDPVAASPAARLNEMMQGGNHRQENTGGGRKNVGGTSDPLPISAAALVQYQQVGN